MDNVQNKSIGSMSHTTLSKPCSGECKRFFCGPKCSEYSGTPRYIGWRNSFPEGKVEKAYRKRHNNIRYPAWSDIQTPTYAHTTWEGVNLLFLHSHVSCVDRTAATARYTVTAATGIQILGLCTSCHNLSIFLYSCTSCMYCNVYWSVSIDCNFSCYL